MIPFVKRTPHTPLLTDLTLFHWCPCSWVSCYTRGGDPAPKNTTGRAGFPLSRFAIRSPRGMGEPHDSRLGVHGI